MGFQLIRRRRAGSWGIYINCLICAVILGDASFVLFICSAISSSVKCLRVSKTESYGPMSCSSALPSAHREKCLRVSKTESYGLSRICLEMTRQATMPSSSEKCLRVSKTESYTLSRICFEMTRKAAQSLRRRRDFVLQMNNT
jgi:hypothetical protein